MGFTTKERASSNLPSTSVNSKRTVTRVLRHSTRSFGNKPLMALDWFRLIFEIKKTSSLYSKVWSRQKNQRENILLERILFFEIVPTTIFLISINILFVLFSYFCFANFAGQKIYEICAYRYIMSLGFILMRCNHEIYGYSNSLFGIWHMFFLSYNMLVGHRIEGF